MKFLLFSDPYQACWYCSNSLSSHPNWPRRLTACASYQRRGSTRSHTLVRHDLIRILHDSVHILHDLVYILHVVCVVFVLPIFLSFFCLFSVFFLSFFCLFTVFLLSFSCHFPVIFLSFYCLFTVFFYLILLTHIRNHLFSIPILYHFTALCIEKVGLTSFSWVLYAMIEKLACVKIVKAISEKSQQNQQDNKNDSFVVARNISFSVITEKENEIEDEFRSASTTGTTVINPYIIKTPTYSV